MKSMCWTRIWQSNNWFGYFFGNTYGLLYSKLLRKVYLCSYIVINVRNALICFRLSISFDLLLEMDMGSIPDERPAVISQYCRGRILVIPFLPCLQISRWNVRRAQHWPAHSYQGKIQVGIQILLQPKSLSNISSTKSMQFSALFLRKIVKTWKNVS